MPAVIEYMMWVDSLNVARAANMDRDQPIALGPLSSGAK